MSPWYSGRNVSGMASRSLLHPTLPTTCTPSHARRRVLKNIRSESSSRRYITHCEHAVGQVSAVSGKDLEHL
jgi:hypothetical protein